MRCCTPLCVLGAKGHQRHATNVPRGRGPSALFHERRWPSSPSRWCLTTLQVCIIPLTFGFLGHFQGFCDCESLLPESCTASRGAWFSSSSQPPVIIVCDEACRLGNAAAELGACPASRTYPATSRTSTATVQRWACIRGGAPFAAAALCNPKSRSSGSPWPGPPLHPTCHRSLGRLAECLWVGGSLRWGGSVESACP